MLGWVWLCSWLTCWVTMWCPDVFASLNFAPVVYSEDHQTEPKSGFEIVGLETIFSGSAYINDEQFQEHAVSFFEPWVEQVLVHFIILGEDQLSVQCWVSLALDSAAWNWESEALPPAVFKESWKPSKSHWTSKLKVQFSVNAVLAKKSQLQSHYQISSQYWCLFMQITSSQFLLDQISSNCPSLNLFSNMVQVIPTFCFNCSTYWVMMVLGGRQNMVWICDWSSCQCGGSCLLWLYTLRISLCVKASEIWLILKDPGCSQLLMVVLLHLLTS